METAMEMKETEDGRLISKEEFAIIQQVRKLRPFDKIIIAKNQSGTRITTTLIRQDQMTFEISK